MVSTRAMFLWIPAPGLTAAALVAQLSAGLILFETSRIVNGGETSHVLATVDLSAFNPRPVQKLAERGRVRRRE